MCLQVPICLSEFRWQLGQQLWWQNLPSTWQMTREPKFGWVCVSTAVETYGNQVREAQDPFSHLASRLATVYPNPSSNQSHLRMLGSFKPIICNLNINAASVPDVCKPTKPASQKLMDNFSLDYLIQVFNKENTSASLFIEICFNVIQLRRMLP